LRFMLQCMPSEVPRGYLWYEVDSEAYQIVQLVEYH
jgi:hypothetical protein